LASEAGFALIEVMVSAVLVVALATATLSIIEKSGQASSTNRQRGVAVGLAQADQDKMRLLSLTQLTNRHVTEPAKRIGGTDYVVQSDASWLRDSGGKVTCAANTTRAEYVKTTTKVTWTGHPAPVVMESYISPGVAGLAKGALTVKLKADAGVPTTGIAVTAQGQTVYTDEGGCAVFANLTPGATTVSWDGTGPGNYVDRNGYQKAVDIAEDVTIGTAMTSQVERLFDHAGKVPVRFVTDDATPAAVNWSSVSVMHSGIQDPTTSVRSFVKTAPVATTEADQLFPFVAPYSLFSGSCPGNAPTTWYPAATMPTAVVPSAGSSTQVDVKVPVLMVYATTTGTTAGSAVQNAKISVAKQSTTKMAGCAGLTAAQAPTTYPSPVPAGQRAGSVPGSAFVPLPYGQYQLCVEGTVGGVPKVARENFNNTPRATTTTGELQTHEVADASNPIPTGASVIAGNTWNTISTTNPAC
jgi:type II secretory pathway pseudopilin PulG